MAELLALPPINPIPIDRMISRASQTHRNTTGAPGATVHETIDGIRCVCALRRERLKGFPHEGPPQNGLRSNAGPFLNL